MSLSWQLIALVLTTKNNQTQHYIHLKHSKDEHKNLPQLTEQTKSWFCKPFTTSSLCDLSY